MEKGTVIKSTGSWYNVKLHRNQTIIPSRIKGKFRLGNMKVTNPVAVGDHVMLSIDKEDEELIGTIQEILPRINYVVRQSPRKKHYVHLMASNIDQAVLIVTMVEPQLKVGFIDRFLLMTEPYNIPVIIVFNKTDVYSQEDFEYAAYLKAVYENIGYQVVFTSAHTGKGVGELKSLLIDKISLVSGQSGVGKSTLVNAVEKDLELKTQELSGYSGKGQHTTTFAEMFDLKDGGHIIDTPGIKTLGFNHFEVMDVTHNFREFFILSEECKYNNCTHRNEPKCAVKQALKEGAISSLRYDNYLNILQEIEDQNYWERHQNV